MIIAEPRVDRKATGAERKSVDSLAEGEEGETPMRPQFDED
jgi:hypothetical protein